MSVTVLLVDDHPVVRSGLVALLATEPGVRVLGDVATGEDAVDRSRALTPDVVLTDLRLGDGIDGVETTRRLRELPHPPQVVILTTYDHDADIVRAVEAGAAGYLLKDAAPEAIVAAVLDAAGGRTVLAPEVQRLLVASLRRDPRSQLSERELEVLRLVARGDSNAGIARALFISQATVKTHLVHIFDKLGAENRTEAVALARDRRLL